MNSYRFFHLDGIDFNPEQFRSKFIIEFKSIIVFNLTTFGDLCKNPRLTTSQ